MNGTDRRTSIGAAAGSAGEWMHYIGAIWLAFGLGGPFLVAVYLVAASAPSALVRAVSRPGSMAAPLGVAALAISLPDPGEGLLVAAGLAVGVGTALSCHPPAWTWGISGGQGWGGILGAVAGTIAIGSVGVGWTMGIAAILLTVATLLGEDHRPPSPIPSRAVPAGIGMAFVTGLRILEPAFLESAAATGVFATAWVVGSHVGVRASLRTDARAIVAAPFAGAAAVAVFGVSDGPSMPFIYGAIGASAALACGARPAGGGGASGRGWLFAGAVAGAAWAALAPADAEAVTYGAAAVALAGGFATLVLATRRPAPGQADLEAAAAPAGGPVGAAAPEPRRPLPAPVAEPAPAPALPAIDRQVAAPVPEELQRAAADLRAALARASAIRGEALRKFRAAMTDPVAESQRATAGVVDDLLDQASAAAARLQRAAR